MAPFSSFGRWGVDRYRGGVTDPIPLADLEAALLRISTEAVVTPVVRSDALDEAVGAEVLCKAESEQRAGAFKFRGAFNRLSMIPDDDRHRGVVAVSSGNHGAAVALAGRILGIAVTVHIPEDAPVAKRRLIEEAGAEIRTFPAGTGDRESGARAQVAETGATFVHPFEDPHVMRGQGTTALEFHGQVGPLDVLLVPMSGGGLMAGCASAMYHLDPGCRMVGVEPALADDTRQSFEAGRRVFIDPPRTIADGLAVVAPGKRTLSINRGLVAEVRTVTEQQISDATRFANAELGVTLEPSGAVGIAALLDDPGAFAGLRVGVILSGGNLDPDRLLPPPTAA
ncbi:MAG: threonine/serine dehydratase [Acidimicrobiia bacterium]|nr:threonine/serine dehydratase [Acidimicrobiia bacterium]